MSYEDEVKRYEEQKIAQLKALVKEEYKQYILDYLKAQDKPCSNTQIINDVFGKIMDITSRDHGPTNISIANANMNMLVKEKKIAFLSNNSIVLSEWGDRVEKYEQDIANFYAKADGEAIAVELLPALKDYWAAESPARVMVHIFEKLEPLLEKLDTFLDAGIRYFKRRRFK